MIASIFVVICFLQLLNLTDESSIPKQDIVTICTSSYCDELEPINWCPDSSELHYYITSEAGDRFRHDHAYFQDETKHSDSDFKITINPCQKYQKIVGFGGALTDASALMINCLSSETKKKLLTSYFDPKIGIGIYFLRVPLGGTDFSEGPYTYDDSSEPDPDLTGFALNELDLNYKIPIIKEAQDIRGKRIYIKVATWRFPDWAKISMTQNVTQVIVDNIPPDLLSMASSRIPSGTDSVTRYFVKEEYRDSMARYVSRAVTDYKQLGITTDFVSAGNEVVFALGSDAWKSDDYQKWVTDYLGPQLSKDHHSIKLLALDDMTPFLPRWSGILQNSTTRSYVRSFGIHWYFDAEPEALQPVLEDFATKYPEQNLLSTESSVCQFDADFYSTTDWQKYVKVAIDIIVKLLSWVQGYLYWNIALDFQGGPNYIQNFCYAPVVVDCSADEFRKKVLFYGFGHFSKFVPEESVRIEATIEPSGHSSLETLKVVAFEVENADCERPNIVVIALNTNEEDVTVDVCFVSKICASVQVPSNSVTSFVALKSSDCKH